MELADIRRLTPITQEYAYFQSSGFSPKMEPVIEETLRWARFHNAGAAAPGVHEEIMKEFEATREKVARSMNAEAAEIVLGENTTIGINIVANGIDWRAGDNVILSDKEHPGNRITWYSHVKRYGIELRFLRVVHDEERMLEEFEGLIDARTRGGFDQPCVPAHGTAAAGSGAVRHRPCARRPCPVGWGAGLRRGSARYAGAGL